MLAKQQKIAQEILLLQKQINILPDGKFICARNQMYPKQLIHRNNSGIMMRSKSEVLISNYLLSYHIPFRYECELVLGDSVYYPDFTLLHPKTKALLYWEHFGLMDNPGYITHTFSKLPHYALSGIVPSINLITTYETKMYPLNSDAVIKLVENYFLS